MQKRIFYSVVVLLAFSCVMVYSLSAYSSVVIFGYSQVHFVFKQFIASIVGILFLWGISNFNMDNFFRWFGWFLFLGSAICIIGMPFFPESIATSAGGAKRWIRLGFFSFAPLEFFKLGFVFFLSWSFIRKFSKNEKLPLKKEFLTLVPHLIIFFVFVCMIVLFLNDFGQVFLLTLSMFVMFFYAGGSLRLISTVCLLALPFLTFFVVRSQHRILRLKSWWSSVQDTILSYLYEPIARHLRVEDFPEPYQVFHAGNAIWNGGFFGNGIGDGLVKLGFLSEVHTDMILAGISEELGVFSIILFFALFIWGIILPILRIANRVENPTYSLFCIGVACLLCFSLFINTFGVAGLVPVKGMAVPFLSYGGSAIWANCIALGMVLGIAKKIPH